MRRALLQPMVKFGLAAELMHGQGYLVPALLKFAPTSGGAGTMLPIGEGGAVTCMLHITLVRTATTSSNSRNNEQASAGAPATPASASTASATADAADAPSTAPATSLLLPSPAFAVAAGHATALPAKQSLTTADLSTLGLLPPGLFPRLIAKCVVRSQSSAAAQHPQLSKTRAVIELAGDLVCLTEPRLLNAIQVEAGAVDPDKVLDTLRTLLDEVISEVYGALQFTVWATLRSSSTTLSATPRAASPPAAPSAAFSADSSAEPSIVCSLSHIMDAVTHSRSLRLANFKQVDHVQLAACGGLRASYDVFVSYRWDKPDMGFVSLLNDCLRRMSVVEAGHRRRLEIFLDMHRLEQSRKFVDEFMDGLLVTAVAVPMVAPAAITRMTKLTAGNTSSDSRTMSDSHISDGHTSSDSNTIIDSRHISDSLTISDGHTSSDCHTSIDGHTMSDCHTSSDCHFTCIIISLCAMSSSSTSASTTRSISLVCTKITACTACISISTLWRRCALSVV